MATIGLCEDDPAIRRVVGQALGLSGHSVVTAHTQHGPGQLTVLHGSASQMPVSGMQRWPFPHWVTAQVSMRHWPVA